MATHSASVTINAPASQVYQLWTHFNDFPKFMTFVKEVTYKDDQTSHWVAEIVGRHEWDAVNENWIADRQIGWRSIDGLNNSGIVTFDNIGASQTRLSVTVNYNPPAGIVGDLGEVMGAGSRFEHALAHDLSHFAEMVNQAPAGALDPTSSSYLFHEDSASGRGETTEAQDRTLTNSNYQSDDSRSTVSASGNINQAFPNDENETVSTGANVIENDRSRRDDFPEH